MKDILPLWNNSTLPYLHLSCGGKRFHQCLIDSNINKMRDFPRSPSVLKTAVTLKTWKKFEIFLKNIALIISGADAILVFDN